MANGSPALSDDERQRQLAALVTSGKFPGAQSALQGLGGNQPQPAPPQGPPLGPPGGPPPPSQAALATPGGPVGGSGLGAAAAPPAQPPAPEPLGGGGAPPAMQLPGQGGIMGFLGNPMVQGLLTGYLNAIRTPRYQGRGALMANAGLGFLSGMGSAEQAISQQEKDKLEMEQKRLEISKNQKVADAWANIQSGKGTDADYLLVGQANYLDKKQHREDVIQVNKTNGLLFAQDHPGPLGARIAGAMMKNTDAVVSQEDAEKAYQSAVKDPTLADEVTIGLQQKKAELAQTRASTAASTATAAEAQARLPGLKAEAAEKQEEARVFGAGTPEEKRRKVFGGPAPELKTIYGPDGATKEVEVGPGYVPPDKWSLNKPLGKPVAPEGMANIVAVQKAYETRYGRIDRWNPWGSAPDARSFAAQMGVDPDDGHKLAHRLAPGYRLSEDRDQNGNLIAVHPDGTTEAFPD